MSKTTIEDLPCEILEYIFSLLPPYKDVKNCRAVNRQWNEIASCIIPRVIQNFQDYITSQNVTWRIYPTVDAITKRYAHSACRYRDSMYVFGGFTSSFSSFNDLWELDLSSKIWSRLSVKGRCPIPKAGATMVTYGNKLILFGGMLPAMHRTFYQDVHFHNRRLSDHVNLYHITENSWEEVTLTGNCMVPGLAGHSATIHTDMMIIFGGLQIRKCVNDIYSLNLSNMEWKYQAVVGDCPQPRFGHSQIFIDDQHLLILGGVSDDSGLLDDVWLLDMSSDPWHWIKVDMGTQASLIKSVWCHSTCRVGKFLVLFKPATINVNMYSDWFTVPLPRHSSNCWKNNCFQPEVNVNGKRGILSRISVGEFNNYKNKSPKKAFSANMRGLSSIEPLKQSSCINRQFEALNMNKASIEMNVFDLSHILDEGRLVHVRSKFRPINFPKETILYSVVEGNGELILFGGIQKDTLTNGNGSEDSLPEISNSLQIIKLKTRVI